MMTTGKGVAEVGFVGAALRVLGERGFAGVLALRVLVLRAGFAGVDLATVEAVGMQIQMHLTLISYRQSAPIYQDTLHNETKKTSNQTCTRHSPWGVILCIIRE